MSTTLTLEITESALVNDSDFVLERLAALHRRGIVPALDDFGTGYSSLSHLHRFPSHVLKIDRSFLSAVDTTADRSTILDAIVSRARSLDLSIVAGGIEHESLSARLQELGCDLGQGFLYSRPVPAAGVDGIIGSGAGTRSRWRALRRPEPPPCR